MKAESNYTTEKGFDTIYSRDRHLLAAATHFGIAGVDMVAGMLAG